MNEYSSVEIVPLHGQQLKNDKPSSSILSFHRENDGKKFSLMLKDGSTILLTIPLDESVEQLHSGLTGLVLSFPKQENRSYLLKFNTQEDLQRFKKQLLQAKFGQTLGEHGSSQFDRRTEESSAIQYFQFYGYLSQQQNMMQDYIRTSAYQRAILSNSTDFSGKVVLDVGAGSGILSFFAAQAGARKVYAVEASSMAQHAKTLVEQNHLSNRIQVIAGKIEEITVPEPVDIIISEPMGYMLYNERMLETYLHAKKWLKPNGKMFPTTGDLFVTPFTDEALYMEQVGKANFWYQQSFYGVDLTSLRDTALEEYFKQPIVDNFDIRLCLAKPIKYSVNFLTAHEEDLQKIHIPLTFQLNTTALIHGLAFWFDVSFQGSSAQIWLSTAPTQPLTHWYQVRCLFLKPLTVTQGHTVHGHATLHSNRKQSYDVEIFLQLDGTTISTKNVLDLKNPYFRYPSQPMQVPPGQHHESPTEQYWNSLSNEQPTATMTLNNNHVNPMVYSQQHCHVNNHLPSILDPMVGNPSNPLSSQIPSSNSQQFNLSNAASPNYFDHLTTQMANGFISFANSATTNLQSQQRNSSS